MIELLLLAASAALQQPALVPLLDRARVAVPDAREIADLKVCPPQQVSRDGRRFTVLVSLSRPRAPRSYYRAHYQDGRVVAIRDLLVPSGFDGLDGLAARSLERRFETCRFVPAAEVAAAWVSIDGHEKGATP